MFFSLSQNIILESSRGVEGGGGDMLKVWCGLGVPLCGTHKYAFVLYRILY